ncbi:Predicted SnoaL-like aldol condensation-catalyzing enzyme [Devosia crocina]|uniref:Predicted SnoaL-like aldol condensation-catalyzing enzyme n=2 Tax=Devosia crocina TaxID=429728 RepID=A0A1I7MYT6_9HYPH|nr:Predicted SnoaL-like aldol condensation-catalyzing enzyme [Devosia crocina]
MQMSFIRSMLVFSAIATAISVGSAFGQDIQRDLGAEEVNRTIVVDFYDSFFNDHDTTGASEVIAEDYIQHNPEVPDGKEPFVSYFTGFFAENPESRAQIVRSAVEGDLVWLHVHSTNGPEDQGQAVIDIFRLEDGVIVEHWDVIQDVPAQAANANTMF